MTLCSKPSCKLPCRFVLAIWLIALCISAALPRIAAAQVPLNTTTATLLAKAPADECYTALGQNIVRDYPPCATGQILKVNQAYVWSEVDTGDNIWFGTTANPLCTTEGAVSQGSTGTTPYQTPSWACEYGSSAYVPPLPASLGDFRPPRIYIYNKASKVVTDITPHSPGGPVTPDRLDPLLQQTVGLRTAVVAGNYVIFAGPLLTGGIAFFGYDIASQQWIAKGTLSGYIDVRSFVNVSGAIYAGVAKALGGGSVLRYTGSFAVIPPPTGGQGAGTCPACFSFDTVGLIDSEAAGLTMHNGRMYVSTWPNGGLGGIVMGPPIPSGGYTKANVMQWLKVWDANQYEPDPVTATTYAGGALASFGGYLYWGTINVPFTSYNAWVAAYGQPVSQQQAEQVIAYTFRSAAMFRTPGFDTSPAQVDLLYGATKLYVYTPPAGGGTTGTWAPTPNKMGVSGLYGGAGINNTYNVYIWSMALWQNKLWVGTFDWSWVVAQSQTIITIPPPPTAAVKPPSGTPPPALYGADLFFFNDTNSAAVAEDTNGLGNITNYGVRNMLPSGDSMYVGMANNANLLADPATQPNGGWELILLQPITTTAPKK